MLRTVRGRGSIGEESGVRLGGHRGGGGSSRRESLLCGVTGGVLQPLTVLSWVLASLCLAEGGLPVLVICQPPEESVCWVLQAESDLYPFLPPECVSLSPCCHNCLVFPVAALTRLFPLLYELLPPP